ncbi:hypothetical protein ST201phi2-1p375 [Pseudomonas phage 201phi2-1]|uniref:Uncharacterized protein n=1 Tax=Pseudomonas phage 201phi2-1 TaxID=198110 RepID=B3FJN5_BP201|nr:hypothetical protein ST201phi2-1p375 [Pseudomonas phage 201phi2-1]ABY63200.1 hypothetical protein 201phi2-1p375 [Pseudomonas phage 201phi2-1]
MQLHWAELFILGMWTLAGGFTFIGELFKIPVMQCQSLFGVTSRWGKFSIGLALLAFVIMRTTQWLTSENPTINWQM